jgi:PAS domain S-box-containing protein
MEAGACMTAFFSGQMDYIYAVYGLGLFFLALVTLSLSRVTASRLPWKWLAASAALRGLNVWVVSLMVSAGHGTGLTIVRVALLAASCICLFEFARRGWAALGRRRFSLWLLLPLAALAALGGIDGSDGLNVTIRYAIGIPGGLWSALVIYRYARAGSLARKALLTAVTCMVPLTLIENLVGPKARLVPASIVNRDAFLSGLGFPVQLVSLALGVGLAVGLWWHHRALLTREHPRARERASTVVERSLVVAVLVVLACGWVITGWVGRSADAQARSDLMKRTAVSAAAINPTRLEHLTATRADVGTADYQRLRQQLMQMEGASPDVRWFYLMGLRGQDIIFTVDSVPKSDPNHAEPGVKYQQPPAGLPAVFTGGQKLTIGPYSDEYGTFVSGFAPILDLSSRRIVGTLGLDINASGWASDIATHRLSPILVTLLLVLIIFGALAVHDSKRLASLRVGESEAMYRSILENMQDVFYRTDADGDLIMASPSFARVFGFDSVEQAYGLNVARDLYVNPEDRTAFLRELETNGAANDYEVAVKRSDGSHMTISSNSTFYHDAAGNVLGVEGVLRDVTERRRTEAALRLTQLSVDHAADLIHWMAPDGRLLYASDSACRRHGYAREEMLTKTVFDLDPDMSPEAWPEHWRELKERGSLTFEAVHKTKGG